MEGPTSRIVADRDLRHLSTDDLLKLIREDCRELDALISTRRALARGHEPKPAPKHRTAKEAVDAVMRGEEPPEVVSLHSVTCCNHHMGDFPPWARVRCPFCNEWHRAGDFPSQT
ncbi:MAG TPA: hypothetical protein VNT75_09485 [Symbiobacteriaceae bacterium]|nr:hypothetical protein [Symbiobacteriaceae bacterium]